MCDKAKNYLGIIREYSKEIIMLLGFGLLIYVYNDFSQFTQEAMQQQARTAEILSNIEVRIGHLEREHERWNKKGE